MDERQFVELPLLYQLKELGWQIVDLTGKQQQPEDSYRESNTEVVLLPVLKESLKKINPFLEDDQVSELARRITTFPKASLMECNQQVLQLLLENTSVSENRKTKEHSPTVRYIDFEKPENNSFIAVCQFKVRIFGSDNHILPDVVLFVNGLPLVVIECKSPKVKEPIAEGIQQFLRYSEQRGDEKEGNRTLFYYNQFFISTCRDIAKFGTITTHIEKLFFRWIDPYPKQLDELDHGAGSPNDQQRIVAGMLDPKNLLDLLRTYTVFSVDDKGRTIKIVGRYQQFRAVKKTVTRLLEGNNRQERSGIIWHTQGSGKSLTMMFLVREMYRHDSLKDWKIVFITDRTQLEKQLHETSASIGFKVKKAESIEELKGLLKNTSSDLVMGMIHKFHERDLRSIFPELNTSSKILVLTDEAHRSQFQLLGANLDRAIPNATEIGFTGTPTEKTEKKYGAYIDKYTMRESNEDGVTLEIVYEGRTHNAEVKDQKKMDVKFADVFSDYNIEERLQILGYGSREAYLEAKETIQAKAKDLVDHYVEHIFPNGFKAQVVAVTRMAAKRYKDYIDEAMKEKISSLEKENPLEINLARLRKLQTAVVISGGGVNDKAELKPFTDPKDHDRWIASFKLPFDGKSDEGDITGEIGIIIVNEMLLTGFDAPIEQVLYLDRKIVAHNLLQAIARVNRIADEKKSKGFVIDYVGVGHHLKEALDAYAEKEQQEILSCLQSTEQDLNDLIAAHKEIWDWLKKHNLTDLNDLDAFFDLFYDEDVRFEFLLLYKKFAKYLDLVLPKKEALDFIKDFYRFSEINVQASKHLDDSRMSMRGIPDKLRVITDEYLKSKNIEQKIAPISILSEDFLRHVNTRKRTKTQAAEIQHAIVHHLQVNMDDDPELYASFSEAIQRILEEFAGNWEMIRKLLEELRERIRKAEQEPNYGLHRKKQLPFFRIFKSELFDNRELNEDEISHLVRLTIHVEEFLENELRQSGFWRSITKQNRAKGELQKILLSEEFSKLPGIIQKRQELISRVMEVAEKKNDTILYSA
ncbi:MAG: HsdR family type I site-specific deoxyribonuclease [Chitinophagales bacterium]|nr:HsdR family type I site-specific deoxyribonuclease [Chitinophagales bacterium]